MSPEQLIETFKWARGVLHHAIARDHKVTFDCIDCRDLMTLDVRFDQATGESRDLPFQIIPAWELGMLMNPDARKQWLKLEVERLASQSSGAQPAESAGFYDDPATDVGPGHP